MINKARDKRDFQRANLTDHLIFSPIWTFFYNTFSKNANSEKVPIFFASARVTSLIALLDFFYAEREKQWGISYPNKLQNKANFFSLTNVKPICHKEMQHNFVYLFIYSFFKISFSNPKITNRTKKTGQ